MDVVRLLLHSGASINVSWGKKRNCECVSIVFPFYINLRLDAPHIYFFPPDCGLNLPRGELQVCCILHIKSWTFSFIIVLAIFLQSDQEEVLKVPRDMMCGVSF